MDDPFLLVLSGHLLGDFAAQTDWQATNKERRSEPLTMPMQAR
jgi:hypothetical protein